jgi:DNA polymerase-3 subunit alpha
VQYLAALLTSIKDDKDKTAVYLAECRVMGIKVLVPDVNTSVSNFAARVADADRSITFGLSAIRNVGEGLVGKIVAEREANGPFADFYDFCERVDPMVLNKKTIESLIKGGAFDSVGHPRKGLCLVFEQIVDRVLARRRERELGVMSLFGDGAPSDDGTPVFDDARVPIPDLEFDKSQRLAFEKEMLGLYISDHPLLGAETALRKIADTTITDLRSLAESSSATPEYAEVRTLAGVVTSLSRKYTKKGELMATFVLEDLASTIEAWVFPRTMEQYGALLADDAIVCVKGRLDLREDQPKLVVMEVRRPEIVLDGGAPVRVRLPMNALSDTLVERLKEVLVRHGGPSPVFLHVGDKILRLPDEFNVDDRNGLVGELRVLLGAGCIV